MMHANKDGSEDYERQMLVLRDFWHRYENTR
jgi:hypothetical protein